MKSLSQASLQRRRGRPTLPTAKRKRARNLSISDRAWEGLEAQIKVLGIKTVSDLIEKIGLNQIQIEPLDASPLADVPVYCYLKSLIRDPVAAFWSILAFVERLCGQVGLNPTSDRIYTIVMKASTIVFYVGYTHPDVLINNHSALLRWLCYEIVTAETDTAMEQMPSLFERVDPDQVEKQFCKIGNAFDGLEAAARSAEYEALKMKTIDGLTIKQISRIFALQGHAVSPSEVVLMIKKGLANFRQLFYAEATEYLPLSETLSPQKQLLLQTARSYLEFASQPRLDSASQQAMKSILLETAHNPHLDFWLNEIDYDLGGQNVQVRERVAEALEEHLLRKKEAIDRPLTFCRTMQQIRQLLQAFSSKESGTQLSVDLLLGER